MFDSKISDWNIVARTPYKKDPLKMLADECHRQGIKLFFYYSQLDWHNPDYYPRGVTNWDNGRPDHGDFNAYLDNYMDGQLRELLTNYGKIGGVWFDGMWDKPDADWHLQKTYALIHQLQPAASDDKVERRDSTVIQHRSAAANRVDRVAGDVSEHQERQIAAPDERHQRQPMLVRRAHQGPHHQHREGEDQRFREEPREAQIAAAPANLDFAHEDGAPDSPLDTPCLSDHSAPFLHPAMRQRGLVAWSSA